MKGKQNAAARRVVVDFVDRALDLIRAWHEHQDVAISSIEILRHRPSRQLPRRIVAGLVTQVLDLDRIRAPFRRQCLARGKVAFKLCAVERRGHDDDLEIGTPGVLQFQSPRKADIAEEVTLMKLIENDRGDAI